MRTLIAWTLTLAVGAWAAGSASAQGQQPQAKKTAPPNAARPAEPAPLDPAAVKARQDADEKARQDMLALLAAWEKQSKKTVTLDVGFQRIDKSKAWGTQYFKGRAMLKSPDLACLEFQKYKLDADGKPTNELERDPSQRIVCNGEKVVQYEYDEKVIYVHPLDKEVRQKTLQQGPLPFLFNMKAADAWRRYGMRLLQDNGKEYVISIVPREKIDKDAFDKAFLWLNKETFLPNRLRLYPAPGGAELQEFLFTGEKNTIQPNRPMDASYFEPSLKMAGWKTIHNPGGNGAPVAPSQGPVASPGQAAQVKRQAAQPAMRPSTRPQ